MDRRAFVSLVSAAVLGGCGFEPLHRTTARGSAVESLSAIRVESIPDRSGQVLRNYLLDRLTPRGAPARHDYTLRVRLQEPRQTLALRRDDVISRIGYAATASFELVDASGRRLMTGISTHSTDYEVTNSEFATLISAQNARDRVLEQVGDDIRNQLAAFFSGR